MTFGFFGIVFLIIGIWLLSISNQIIEKSVQYDTICGKPSREDPSKNICQDNSFKIELKEKVEGPVFVYYQLDNFYQNHRRYVKSRSDPQLAGEYRVVKDLSSCDPITTVDHLWDNQKTSKSGKQLADDMPAIPCGLVAKSYFNDTFTLQKVGEANPVDIKDDKIAWESDIAYKFNNIKIEGKELPERSDSPTDWKDIQWLDMTEERFIVWMRTAGLPNFRKLWGRIPDGLAEGTY